ncbi:MAG TPA: hypothetical protein VJ023_16290, partial [Pyrinomonadaceae bacterium]|nr:hypothetical protein [Pyrinomonadaceae bacterium]
MTSLAEPSQFGSTFSYVYDLAGRLSSLSGSPYGGVTTYASNFQYRAWGALKHLNYGNSKTLDATYNARMTPVSFTIPGVISKTYQHYADGSMRFSSDATNHKWDRFYSYDHAARIKEAFSGAEARFEPLTNDRPYRQTFNFDGFGHLTARTSLNWEMNYSTTDSYTNNRRNGWSYDAEGNLLSGAHGPYTYDAGGRISTAGSYD